MSIITEPMTQAEFEDFLDKVKRYSLATVKGQAAQPLPRSISLLFVNAKSFSSESLNQFEKTLNQETGSDMKRWKDGSESAISEVTEQKLDQNITDDEWELLLNKKKEEDIKFAVQKIEDVYKKVIERGKNHPEEREALIAILNTITGAIKLVVDIVVSFLEEIARKIWLWLKETFEKIKITFITVTEAITNFFG
ncbi:hypothetical protein ACL6C3_06825 [Capilliphycus salinus ALCB114379]|uniref:hypothetical protein n=1 Tax=Capilliphycus salinus TaxID=2768948 RepID=UPI0039A58CEC